MVSLNEVYTTFEDGFEPILSLLQTFDKSDFTEEDGGIVLVGHEPERGLMAYAVTLFPGLSIEDIERYEEATGIDFPKTLKKFLQRLNGAFLSDLSIYGIPTSMLNNPPLLSRSVRNPYDVATATKLWRLAYEDADHDEFHFSGRNISWSGQIGYFLRKDGSVVSYPKNKTVYKSQVWPSLDEWLRDEIDNTILNRPVLLEEVESESRKANKRYQLLRFLPWNWHRWWNR